MDTIETNPINTPDITRAVREAAMLAYVSIGSWSATERDDELMEGVKREHDAEGDVGTVIKYLLAGNDSKLKAVRSAYQAVRNHHYKLTLPWVNDPHSPSSKGPRLLPHLIYPRYLTEIAALRRAAIQELDDFLDAYPDLVTQSRQRLKTMVSSASYPTVEQLRSRFRLHVDFQPIPSGDQFTGLDDHMLERLSRNLREKQERQLADAGRAMWVRVRERIERLGERMTPSSNEGGVIAAEDRDGIKRFKEATIENARELLTLLPGWNVAGNPLVDEVTRDIDEMLKNLNATDLRKNDGLRKETAEAAQKIVDKLGRWGL
jgi:hypothetical protein